MPQAHVKYPYQPKQYPIQMRPQNYINYPYIDATGKAQGLTTSTAMTTRYPLSSTIYSYRNEQPQSYAQLPYTPYSTVPTNYSISMASSTSAPILTEKQFYEYQERLRRE